MELMTAGVTTREASVDDVTWHILGQTYVPKHRSESSMSWHATFPHGTFVPHHVHTTQDEFIYVLTGELELELDVRLRPWKPPGPSGRSRAAAGSASSATTGPRSTTSSCSTCACASSG